MRNACVETDAGDIEEQPLVDFAGIDCPIAAVEGELERRRFLERDAKLTRQTVARSAWHQCKRGVRKRDRRPDLVHRAVAAPCDDRRNAASSCRKRKLTRVPGTLGDEDV